ncbi:MAG TPA: hypothetical protein VN788_11795 [Verrucomicrobiae bacterium]|nr:hypothetical protein [Verrucomicrobiae bacterium]
MVLAASRASCTKFSIPRRAIQTLLLASSSFLHLCRLGVMSAGASTHGTRSVLRRVYPRADIPVVQLSIDETQPPSSHYQIGARLAQLREENVLILSSGNLMHNLHAYAWGRHVQ